MTALGLGLAVVIGLALGLLGGGGSILTVPIFVYVLGMAAKQAIGLSLAVVGTTSLVGAVGHWRDGNVLIRVAIPFGLFAMVGTFAGARLATRVSGTTQLVLFAVVMFAAAMFMFREEAAVPPARRLPFAPVAAEALAVGVITGLVGVGGGFLIVPALVLLGVGMKQAVGTSLVVIAAKSFAGFAGYLDQIAVPWGFLAAFTAIAAVGILAGTTLARRIPAGRLKRAFAILLLATSAAILVERTLVG